ncbi:MAG: hypothetical protein SFW62_03235 [Alphaproteobacteria bacterium]|nr:hypothetical protein [Alphaproteobacteria bacterium]
MYLLVFITLVISLIGVYTQALAVQTSRLFSKQTAVAETMLTWHGIALTMAQYARTNPVAMTTSTGCSMTEGFAGVPYCQASNGATQSPVYVNPNGNSSPSNLYRVAWGGTATTWNCINRNWAKPCWFDMPPSYNYTGYRFHSVLYNVGSPASVYLITWATTGTITAANPSPGYVQLASGNQLGLTVGELLRQIQNTGRRSYGYGKVITVSGQRFLMTSFVPDNSATVLQYPVPLVVPDGAVAVLSLITDNS